MPHRTFGGEHRDCMLGSFEGFHARGCSRRPSWDMCQFYVVFFFFLSFLHSLQRWALQNPPWFNSTIDRYSIFSPYCCVCLILSSYLSSATTSIHHSLLATLRKSSPLPTPSNIDSTHVHNFFSGTGRGGRCIWYVILSSRSPWYSRTDRDPTFPLFFILDWYLIIDILFSVPLIRALWWRE